MSWPRGYLADSVGPPSAAKVLEFAAHAFGVDVRELVGMGRFQPLTTYRLVAMAAAREVTGQSFPALGRMFGDRDHTTILSACRRVEGDERLRTAKDRLVADFLVSGPRSIPSKSCDQASGYSPRTHRVTGISLPRSYQE